MMVELMVKLGITAASLARYYGVSARTVYGWKHVKCPDHVLRHLSILKKYNDALEAVRKA